MGVFDFVRDAGTKIGVGDENQTNAKAVDLEKHVTDLGFPIDDLEISFDDGKAEVSGTAVDQALREKIILAVGNVDGVETVEDNIKVTTSSPESSMHNVIAGDTLSKIAEEVYGDPAKYTLIFEANQPLLKDPDEIYVGQMLRIPAA